MPDEFKICDYQALTKEFNVCGGAIISGSFHGFNQDYLIATLNQFGSSFCGVTQLPFNVTDEQIITLNNKGIKAIRFNIKRTGPQNIGQIEYLAKRVYDLANWHSEFYVGPKDFIELLPLLTKLPAVSIDHLGLSQEISTHMLTLIDKGVRVKASGFGRVDFNVKSALQSMFSVNPDAVMFGTDLPSTRSKQPFNSKDIELIQEAFDDNSAAKILFSNAINWYFK